jgi:hypothetical protein
MTWLKYVRWDKINNSRERLYWNFKGVMQKSAGCTEKGRRENRII